MGHVKLCPCHSLTNSAPSRPSDIFAAEGSTAGKLGEVRPASRHAHGHGIRHPILTDHAVLTQVTSVARTPHQPAGCWKALESSKVAGNELENEQ